MNNTWTAEIISIEDNTTTKTVTFKFESSDGRIISGHVAQGFTSDEQVKRYAQNQIKAYTDKDSMTLAVGVLDLTPPVPPTPTDAEKAKTALNEKINTLRALKEQVSLGLLDDAAYQATLTDVKATADVIAIK